MSPYAIEECCEEYRQAWLHEILIYIALMTVSGFIGFCFGVMS